MLLPRAPAGCETRVFHVKPGQFRDAPFDQMDWTNYLQSNGITFPKGGFAAYYAPSNVLIIASDSQNLDLLLPVGI